MLPTPYVASLRIYEPLSAFSPAESLRWSALPATKETNSEEQNRALIRIVTSEPPALKPDGAHIIDIDGKRYVCPWSTAARCWAALENFKTNLPNNISKLFLPTNLEEAISINSEMIEDKIPHIINETWMIPPRWFSLFKPDERTRGYNESGPFTFLRTSIGNAKQRCMFTHQTVVASFGNGPIEQEIADLLEWMDLFHQESIVELDYGGLATYLDRVLKNNGELGIESDTSVEDLHLSLSGLSQGDGARAGHGYERLISRWRRVAAFEQAM